MNIDLDPIEVRVIGSLMEKSMITPEQYPLSLNALVNACNQKSSREPVMDLAERQVVDALDRLQRRYLVREKSTFGARVAKYHYRLFNDEIGDFRFSEAERAVVCLLLLRGPQTPGELRSRAGRMYAFANVDEVENTLQALRHYEQGPFVAPLTRQPGRREIRYLHLFDGATPDAVAVPDAAGAAEETSARRAAAVHPPTESPPTAPPPTSPPPSEDLAERVMRLEQRVADLERALAGTARAGSSSGDL